MNLDSFKEFAPKHTSGNASRTNICLVRGNGNIVYDASDRAYIDFTGGYGENVLGYKNPVLLHAAYSQLEKLPSIGSSFYDELSDNVKRELTEGTVFEKVLLEKGGAEALASAIHLINRFYAKKSQNKKILIVSDSLDSISYGSCYKNHYNEKNQMIEFTPQNDFDEFRKNLTSDVGAVILENFQPKNGLSITKHDFLLQAYVHCKSKGALLVMSELISGVGRTGQMFSFQYSGINPDMVILSNGLGGGLPLGAVLARGEIGYTMSKSHDNYSTAFLPSLAAARVVIKELKCGLNERIVNIGNYFKAKLFKLSKFDFVREIRGSGLILGMELDQRANANEIVSLMAKEGVLTIASPTKNTILFMPPYTITRQEINVAIESMTKIFSKIL